MTTVVTSRRADTGLPDVANDWAYSDDTYFDDGFTWTDHAGSVLAGTAPLYERYGRIYEPGRGQGYERPGMRGYGAGRLGGNRLSGRAMRHAFGE